MSLPEKDRYTYSKRWCMAFISIGFGGRIAEEMFTGDMNNGVGGDIRMVTSLARRMITEWGMNDRVGFVFYGEDENRQNMFDFGGTRDHSEETAKVIDEEVKKLIDRLFEETRAAPRSPPRSGRRDGQGADPVRDARRPQTSTAS